MHRQTRLIAAILLLVVGPTAVLSLVAAWLLNHWQVVIERQHQSDAEAALQAAVSAFHARWAAADARLGASIAAGLAATPDPWRLAGPVAALAASNEWARRVYVWSPAAGLVYPPGNRGPSGGGGLAEAEPGTAADGNAERESPAGALTRLERLECAPGRWEDAAREYEALSGRPEVSPYVHAVANLRLARGWQRAGRADLAVADFRKVVQECGPANPGRTASAVAMEALLREPDEGFLLCLLAGSELLQIAVEQNRPDTMVADLALLLEELTRHYGDAVPLQKALVTRQARAAWAALAAAAPPRPADATARVAALLNVLDELERAAQADAEESAAVDRTLRALAVESHGQAAPLQWMGAHGRLRFVAVPGFGPLRAGYCVAPAALAAALRAAAERVVAGRNLRVLVRDRTNASAPPPDAGDPLAVLALPAPCDTITLLAYPQNPAGLAAAARLRVRLYRWGVLLLGAGVMAGAWLVLQLAASEMAVARTRSRFAASVSHDLRTPLASMRMLAESLLLGSIRDEATRQKFLAAIVRECDRLSRLTDRALFFVRMGQKSLVYQLTEGDIGSVVQEAVQSFAGRFREGTVDIRVEVAGGLPAVCFDAGAITQVVDNLLDNAVKYAGASQRVEVRVEPCPGGRDIEIRVQDFGIGMERRDLRKVFREYYRGRNATAAGVGGTGLGLALCRHIVRAHRGRIRAESTLGEGSTLRVFLPVAPAACG